jgi:hypothetical protein
MRPERQCGEPGSFLPRHIYIVRQEGEIACKLPGRWFQERFQRLTATVPEQVC